MKKPSRQMPKYEPREGENVFLDRRYFALDQKDFNRFLKALDKPPADNERLRRTLTTLPLWNR